MSPKGCDPVVPAPNIHAFPGGNPKSQSRTPGKECGSVLLSVRRRCKKVVSRREARDQACLEALARYDAAARIRKAQEAEDRRMAKLKEAEHKRVLRNQEKELRQAEKLAEKQAKKQKRESTIQAKKAESALLRERVERQRSERSLGVAHRQAVQDLEEGVRRRDRETRDKAGRQAL
ncbi:hypothetical protein BKA61DRAFT_673734 [Leptodontidium sp. MPI-SDFR-AT-0119]|nr:hypothetical protein BKA61DRAFT_673734 [Leptodontidium sp. MPI-SDFR-AT-0119]